MIFKEKDIIVFAGDSVTDMGKTLPYGDAEALGLGLGDGYVHTIYDMMAATYPELAVRIINSGIGGNTSKALLDRWQTDVVDFKPDWVSIFIGINDALTNILYPHKPESQVPYDEYEKNLETMITSVQNTAKGVFVISPYVAEVKTGDMLREEMDKYRTICEKIAKKYSCEYIDVQEMFDEYFKVRHQCWIAWDRIHPNRIGAYMIAKAFLKRCGFDYNHTVR